MLYVVGKANKTLESARNNKRGVRYSDFVRLIEALGFVFTRQAGSHAIYVHARPEIPFMNVQAGKDGLAKVYQIEQLLGLIETYKLEVP